MKPDKRLVASILKTLPVGYYLGSRAEVVLDETSPTSFVNMITKEIHVSYRNVADAMEVLPDDSDPVEVEKAIRCFLYHETAHLLMSPLVEMGRREGVLEDERIETLLRDTFHGVDFKRNVYRAWSWSPDEEPKDFDQFFARLVRLRIGPEELLKELDALIAKHAFSYAGQTEDPYDGPYPGHLLSDYHAFIRECKDEWEKPKEETPPPPPAPGGDGAPPPPSESPDDKKEKGGDGKAGPTPPPEEDGGSGGAGKTSDPEDSSSPEGKPSGEEESKGDEGPGRGSTSPSSDKGDDGARPGGGGSAGSTGEESEGGSDDDSTEEPSDKAADEATKKIKAPSLDDSGLDKAKSLVKAMLTKYVDSKTSAGMRRIVVRACNRKAARSGVENGYTGRIDPKSVWRGDYRWLARPGNSGTGKDRLHLRLWVDVSGSFGSSEGALNTLLSTLLDFEREMPTKFSLSVIEMGGEDEFSYSHDPTANRIHDKTKKISCDEGNDFGPNIGRCDIETRKSGWRTMNIVVWDGWALRPYRYDDDSEFSKSRRVDHLLKTYPEACAALNNRQTIIISSKSNKEMISRGMPLARTTYISDGYAEKFTEEVIRQLEYAI